MKKWKELGDLGKCIRVIWLTPVCFVNLMVFIVIASLLFNPEAGNVKSQTLQTGKSKPKNTKSKPIPVVQPVIDKSSKKYADNIYLCNILKEQDKKGKMYVNKIPVDIEECARDRNSYVAQYRAKQKALHHKQFDEKEAKLLREKPRVTAKDTMVCVEAVRNNSKYPSRADVHYLMDLSSWVIRKNDKWLLVIKGGADLMNDLGNMIPHRYGCEIANNKIVNFEMFPG